jgi:hypothetical protein
MRIRPEPTTEEAAAIAAAVEMAMTALVPHPVAVKVSPEWRFRGRWWNRDKARGR